MFRKKMPKKEWTSFEEVYRLLDILKMTKAEFIAICGISSNTFYLWQRKGKIPASTLNVINIEAEFLITSNRQGIAIFPKL